METQTVSLPADNAPMEDSLNLRHYWRVILERRWLATTAFISVVVLCLIYLYRAVPVYQATATLEIDREYENALNLPDAYAMGSREQDYLQTQYKKLKSRSLIESIISELKLNEDPRYAKASEIWRSVGNDVEVVPVRFSRLVEVRVEHTNPVQASNILGALVRKFEENNLAQRKQTLEDAWEKLTNQVVVQQIAVEKADQALQDYKVKTKNVSVEDAQNIISQAMKKANEDLVAAQSKASLAQRMDQEVKGLLAAGISKESIPQVATDRGIQDLNSKLATAQAELANFLVRYTIKHPTADQKQKEVVALQKAIDEAATHIIQSVHNDAIITQSQQDAAQTNVNQWAQEQLTLGTQRMEYDRLNRAAELARTLWTDVLKAEKAQQIAISQKANNIRTIDPARTPLRPIKPRVVLTLFLGVFGGLAVAIGLAFFVNYLDDSIKTQDDVEMYLRLPFLGYVPNIKSNSVIERDLQAHVHPQSTAAEGFRTIRATIALMPNAEKQRLLVITSTIPSEGKSLLASNLAIVTAQTGVKTLLVDADLRRPSVHKAFQLHSPVGLSAYLTENVNSVEEIVHPTEVPNLEVVCAGAIPTNPSELGGSKRMRQFLQEALRRYERVFLDCPPISAVSDPLMIAAMCDGVVFLTKFNKIRREHARKSVQRIQDAGIHLVGVVLNDIDFEGKDSYYYSYYYYQNRYYSSHYRTDAKDKPATPAQKS